MRATDGSARRFPRTTADGGPPPGVRTARAPTPVVSGGRWRDRRRAATALLHEQVSDLLQELDVLRRARLGAWEVALLGDRVRLDDHEVHDGRRDQERHDDGEPETEQQPARLV